MSNKNKHRPYRRPSRPARSVKTRGCRVYQQRTVQVLGRAFASWRAISGSDLPPLVWEGGKCSDLAATVKKFLSQEVTSDPAMQMGFQSIKKLLPDSCRCMESGLLTDLVDRFTKGATKLPQGYLAYVKKEVGFLFPKGWDTTYENHCLTTTPPLSASTECPRSEGGSLGFLNGQAEFLQCVLGNTEFEVPDYRGKLIVVQSAGKPRPLSKFFSESLLLRPLHKTIYDGLSRKKWCLRGPPTREVLYKAGFKLRAGYLVSGDYRSATDFLPVEVMETALEVMLRNCMMVPEGIKAMARKACRPILEYEGESFEIASGQMMGSYLSFPFLCLQNYLAFRWAFLKTVPKGQKPGPPPPLLINGDDILFQHQDLSFYSLWREVVSEVGLQVEESKTSVSKEFGTINSTLLKWCNQTLQPAWSPRFGMLKHTDRPHSLGKSFLDFLRDCPSEHRYSSGLEWFKWHVAELRSASVSLPSLGFRGLLARRLAAKFDLLRYPDAVLPTLDEHDVGFTNADFVTRVPESAVDDELKTASALEVASAKWREGWAPADRVSRAIQYCIARSEISQLSRRHIYPDFFNNPGLNGTELCSCILTWLSGEYVAVCGHVPFFTLSDSQSQSSRHLAFWSNFLKKTNDWALPWSDGLTRRQGVKKWLSPIEKIDYVLIVTSLVLDLSFDLGRGPLPSYQEACNDSWVEVSPGRFFCCG